MSTGLTRRHMLGASATALAFLGLPMAMRAGHALAVDAAPMNEGRIVYEVLRNGGKIGQHVMTFAPAGEGALRVANAIEIAPRVLGMTVYRYEQEAEEVWRDGALISLSTRTNDNGDRKAVQGERDGEDFHIVGADGEERRLTGKVLTSSLWHPRTPYVGELLGLEDGLPRHVSGEPLGRESVRLPDGSVDARRYRLSGDLGRDLWYDDRDRLVRVSFETRRDGSRIEVEPVSVSA